MTKLGEQHNNKHLLSTIKPTPDIPAIDKLFNALGIS